MAAFRSTAGTRRSANQRRAGCGLRAVRPRHLLAVEGGDHLPLAVAVHPNRPLAQLSEHVQRLVRHRPQCDVPSSTTAPAAVTSGSPSTASSAGRLPCMSASTATELPRRPAMVPLSPQAGAARLPRQASANRLTPERLVRLRYRASRRWRRANRFNGPARLIAGCRPRAFACELGSLLAGSPCWQRGVEGPVPRLPRLLWAHPQRESARPVPSSRPG